MKIANLSQMKRGWFVGNFEPSVFKTDVCEIAVKEFKAGDFEEKHYHKLATEITVVVSGHVRMFDRDWGAGDIVVAEPGDVTSFLAITDSVLSVVKLPGVLDDKYLVNEK